jgi:hypothetical protein
LEALTYNPRTGVADYQNQGKQYQGDTIFLNPTENAADKTHKPGSVPSDNARTRAVKDLQQQARDGKGPGANLTEHVMEPSITRMKETGVPEATANEAALHQAGNLFGLQRLSDSAKIIAEEQKAASWTARAAKAWEAAKPALNKAAAVGEQVLTFVGRVFTVLGAATEASKTYDEVPAGPLYINKELAWTLTFVLGIAAGAVDDALMMEPAHSPIVTDSWEQNGSGPAQHLVGEAVRWVGKL